jgi:signal transduction histidine kinase
MKKNLILVVDDTRENVSLMEMMLKAVGYDVLTAYDGAEALNVVNDNPGIDLILLDVMMPKVNGYEVTRTLKDSEATRHIPIVLVTSLKETSEKIAGIEAGCDDFISRPFGREELMARVKSLLRVKTQHDELRDNYIKLKELEELKESLTHMIVHDLNNPLNEMTITLSSIGDSLLGKMNDYEKTLVSQGKSAAENMKRMISNLLYISKMESHGIELRLERFSLSDAVKETVSMMKTKADFEDKKIILNGFAGIPDITADKELIKRVTANLISNALKFINEGSGVINISGTYDSAEKYAHIKVEDNGQGIPPEFLDKIFNKFVQVKCMQSALGSGLGLAFCKLAVEAHEGKIWVYSELGKGTTFEFTIPVK